MICFVLGGKNGMGCYVRGDKNSMGCYVQGGKSLWEVLSGVSKMAWDVLSRDVLSQDVLSGSPNCTHMPQGIAINRLNTPRSIHQASLQKWQLPGQICLLQSVCSVGLIYFLTVWKVYQRVSKQCGSRSGPVKCQTILLIKKNCKAYQQTTQTGSNICSRVGSNIFI